MTAPECDRCAADGFDRCACAALDTGAKVLRATRGELVAEVRRFFPRAAGDALRAEMDKIARQPCAGWVDRGHGGWRLKCGDIEATVHRMDGWSLVFLSHTPNRPISVDSDDLRTVLLAAEDALLAVADEIRRAVGR